jgi:formylglycine-generating enzyme required for sulfatase activity
MPALIAALLLAGCKGNPEEPCVGCGVPPKPSCDTCNVDPPDVSGSNNFSETTDGVNIDMVFVKGGIYTMGCYKIPDAEVEDTCRSSDNNGPDHKVMLNNFYIGKYLVTQWQWKTVMGAEPPTYEDEKGDSLPVCMISWDDVHEFIKKLNEKSGKEYRLPRESEWEYAARGGENSRGTIYSGSNNIDSVAWYVKNSDYGIKPVGRQKPNELGLYDMSGNVLEWIYDKYGTSYSVNVDRSPLDNPTGPETGDERVLRGGSFFDAARSCRVHSRARGAQNQGQRMWGFRIVLPAE